jgi:hypothetical protein
MRFEPVTANPAGNSETDLLDRSFTDLGGAGVGTEAEAEAEAWGLALSVIGSPYTRPRRLGVTCCE